MRLPWSLKLIVILAIVVSPSINAQCLAIGKNQIAKVLNASDLAKFFMPIEVADCSDIALNDNSIGFKLSDQTQKIHNGIRSEIAVDYPFNEGDDVSYSLDVKLPENFQPDNPENRWWSLIQWHDQPDKKLGQTWLNFKSVPPPVSIYVEQRDGIVGVGVKLYGTTKKSWFPFPMGEWLTLTIKFHWSTGDNGSINLNVAGHPEWDVAIHGKNMNNAYQHYLKFGQYRNPQINANSEVFFRNLKIN